MDYTGAALTTRGAVRKLRGPSRGWKIKAGGAKRVANTKSAEKAARQAVAHRERNVTMRSRMRTAIRKVIDAVAAGKKDEAQRTATRPPCR